MLNLPEDIAPLSPTSAASSLPAESQLVHDVQPPATALLTALAADAPGAFKEAKAGYKTTEFWLSLVGVVLTQLGALHLPGKYGATIATVSILGSYALSRGIAKNGVANPD